MKNKRFIETELANIKITVNLMEKFIEKDEWNEAELAGCGKFLADVYMGYENIFRSILEDKGIRIAKGDHWHIDLLNHAITEGITPRCLIDMLKGMLSYRHAHLHGYPHTIREKDIRTNSAEVIKAHPIFEAHVQDIVNEASA